jgi:hypothetical protein
MIHHNDMSMSRHRNPCIAGTGSKTSLMNRFADPERDFAPSFICTIGKSTLSHDILLRRMAVTTCIQL